MKKTKYKTIFLAYLPIGIILFLILKSELSTGFRGFSDFLKYTFFLIGGILVFIYTIIKQGIKIKKKVEVREAKIIITLLLISTFLAIGSLYIPDYLFY
ncbi:hypothetical protein HZY62_10235 [Maribacter polysiphoniae]|uniref:Uncharacterized protein n=1 Tax=Maribacter polysiphoniae TaxID=429344 RepID=A0ABR7VZJ0_9FLAO|nr:hypothetical protein [Maribacter polysiphoniae]MBD1260965.1 hypothetical protein [Maribacter polysiphoniae]